MTPYLADTAPLLRTERLELWRPRAGDLGGIYDAVSPEPVRRFLGGQPTTLPDEAGRLLRNGGSWAFYGYGIFVCREHGETAPVGICGVFHSWRGFGQGMDDVPEAGWIFAQSHWGGGFAREAMTAALGWFDAAHGRRRIACMIEDGHDASLKLADRLGFVRYGLHEQPGENARPLILLERT